MGFMGKIFEGSRYSATIYHENWKHALLEYGKGMDDSFSVSQRKGFLREALQILNLIPDSTAYDGVTLADVKEREDAIQYIEKVMRDL